MFILQQMNDKMKNMLKPAARTWIALTILTCQTSLIAQVYYIPTVVHILYTDPADNMSTGNIQAMINHVNLGLRGLSQNNAVSRIIFDTLWADTEIQICLAEVDPNGLPTDGIVRKYLAIPIARGDFFRMKGASTPWDTDRYLNIWISAMGPGSESYGGIATSATSPHQTFPNPYPGIMLNQDSYNYQQILIHEAGHFFGLDHLYSDDIPDTPCSNNAINPEPQCLPAFLTLNTCSEEAPFWGTTDPPDMIENYMEYYGNCAKMFTKGQKALMREYANTHYPMMINTQMTGCEPELVRIETKDAGRTANIYPNPVQDFLSIDLEGWFSWQLFDLSGKVMESGSGMNTARLNAGRLPKGIYFLAIKSEDLILTRKIAKQ